MPPINFYFGNVEEHHKRITDMTTFHTLIVLDGGDITDTRISE